MDFENKRMDLAEAREKFKKFRAFYGSLSEQDLRESYRSHSRGFGMQSDGSARADHLVEIIHLACEHQMYVRGFTNLEPDYSALTA